MSRNLSGLLLYFFFYSIFKLYIDKKFKIKLLTFFLMMIHIFNDDLYILTSRKLKKFIFKNSPRREYFVYFFFLSEFKIIAQIL